MASNAKSKSSPPTAAQKRLAAERAAAARERIAVAQRRRRLTVIIGAVGAIVVVVAAFLVVKAVSNSSPKSGAKATSANASVVRTLAGIPQSAFDKVGVGGASAAAQPAKPPTTLRSGGKPELLYVGAEWCPICAGERWPLALTLQRFGTLSNLGAVRSRPDDSAPNTASLSFHGASYTSPYITFVGKEKYSNQADGSGFKTLDKLTPSQEKLFDKVTGFPYLNLGGQYILNSGQYDPTVLGGSSMNQLQIAKAIADPSTTISKDVLGSANVLTAQVCDLTDQKPAKVCSSSGVQAAAKALKAK